MVEKILNNTTPYGKIRASHEGSLHSSTLNVHAKHPIGGEYIHIYISKIYQKLSLSKINRASGESY